MASIAPFPLLPIVNQFLPDLPMKSYSARRATIQINVIEKYRPYCKIRLSQILRKFVDLFLTLLLGVVIFRLRNARNAMLSVWCERPGFRRFQWRSPAISLPYLNAATQPWHIDILRNPGIGTCGVISSNLRVSSQKKKKTIGKVILISRETLFNYWNKSKITKFSGISCPGLSASVYPFNFSFNP